MEGFKIKVIQYHKSQSRVSQLTVGYYKLDPRSSCCMFGKTLQIAVPFKDTKMPPVFAQSPSFVYSI